jgi:hypothetical protein
MIVFLPETDRERVKSEIFLDLFQVAIIVGLTFTSLFLLPVQQMLPTDALLRNISVSNLENFLLLAAVAVRLLFARNHGTRALLLRLGFFLASCAGVTYIGNWIDLYHYATGPLGSISAGRSRTRLPGLSPSPGRRPPKCRARAPPPS